MKLKNFTESIVRQVGTDLTDAFDTNFTNKAFFDRKWKSHKMNAKHGLLAKDGHLRGSVKNPSITGDRIKWNIPLPYAKIHNEGGEIMITAKMKSFFWAMFYKSSNAITKTTTGKVRNGKRNEALTQESQQWKALALKKLGDKIIIPQRQFIGWHPQVDQRIKEVVDENVKKLNNLIQQKLKP